MSPKTMTEDSFLPVVMFVPRPKAAHDRRSHP